MSQQISFFIVGLDPLFPIIEKGTFSFMEKATFSFMRVLPFITSSMAVREEKGAGLAITYFFSPQLSLGNITARFFLIKLERRRSRWVWHCNA